MPNQAGKVDSDSVESVLREAELVEDNVTIAPLSGGVSSQVWLVESTKGRLVAKTPLKKLATPQDWFSDISRGQVEADSLRLLRELTPDHVPKVLLFDPELPLLVLEAAPVDWRDWRQVLLSQSSTEHGGTGSGYLQSEKFAGELGSKLGRLLATWHGRTTNLEDLPESIRSGQRLQQLRTDPFHRATAAVIGDSMLSARLLDLADELESTKKCLVYGDFSPKNFLVHSGGLWVIDAETAHMGNPVLDLAFLNAHLMMKAMHKPQLKGAMRDCQTGFMSAYAQSLAELGWRWELHKRLGFHTGAILASRVAGISRATYLSKFTQQEALSKATTLLRGSSTIAI